MDCQCPVHFGPSGPDNTATWRLKRLEISKMGTEKLGKRTLKNEVGFVFDHAAKTEDLCRCLDIAETFESSPVDQWKGLLGANSLKRR